MDGSVWRDAPGYWESMVYPAYVQASAGLFEGGDVEQGAVVVPAPNAASDAGVQGEWAGEGETGGARAVAGLVLIEPLEMTMEDMVGRVCEMLIAEAAREI